MSHLGDTNKMVDTPRMKAAQMAAIEHGTGDVWRVGCDIELELNSAQQRIKRLEEAGDRMDLYASPHDSDKWNEAMGRPSRE